MYALKYILSIILLLLLYFPFNVSAETVQFDVRAIYSTLDGEAIDEEIKPLEEKIKKAFEGYTSFVLLQTSPLELTLEVPASVMLPNDKKLIFTFTGKDDNYIKLNLKIDSNLNTDLRIAYGGTFFQAMTYKEGILIIAITTPDSSEIK